MKMKKVAVIVDTKSDYSIRLASAFKKQFKRNGGKIVQTPQMIQGDKDFSVVLSSILATKPDLIYILRATALKNFDFKVFTPITGTPALNFY